eukprot:scaffold12009_cov61-Cyclotella_meneghiniana.AAC.8
MKTNLILTAFTLPVGLVLSSTLQNQNLRGNDTSGSAGSTSPKLSECLLSAVSNDDCGTAVAGCIWCAEPIYGLCLTESAAQKVRWMPFFTCTFGMVEDESASQIKEDSMRIA